jgi:hypothetical protein
MQFLLFGFLVCLDTFLYNLAVLPLRFAAALVQCLRVSKLSEAQKEDLVHGLVLIATLCALFALDASVLYHLVRGQSTLKLYVVFNVLEVFDKLLLSIGNDIFDSLHCVLWQRNSFERQLRYSLLTFAYVTLHGFVLFAHVITLNVAVNSFNNALLTLLVSNQFVELKGSVFKKFAEKDLRLITCTGMLHTHTHRTFVCYAHCMR